MENYECKYVSWRGKGLNVKGVFEPVLSQSDRELVKYRGYSNIEGYEIIIDDFDNNSTDRWSPFNENNIQDEFMIANGMVILAYQNNLQQRDLYDYNYRLTEPITDVVVVKLRVKIYPGTRFTVDVFVDGKAVSPRFLNYYSGTGDWEEIIIPVNGNLTSFVISITELNGLNEYQSYRAEIDWIKAIVEK